MVDQVKNNLNKINSFTIQGGSNFHFELSQEPNDLIGAIFWQLKRIKIEKYEPVMIGASLESKDDGKKDDSSFADKAAGLKTNSAYVKEYHRLLEQHNLPIPRMGDIDWYWRQRFNFESQEKEEKQQFLVYLRNPDLTDDENYQIHRVYCGNPFVAPGYIGSKTKRALYINGIIQNAAELVADELFEAQDESLMPDAAMPA
jgi:hypothetical protein